jgi:hypothetical protein
MEGASVHHLSRTTQKNFLKDSCVKATHEVMTMGNGARIGSSLHVKCPPNEPKKVLKVSN